MLIPESLLQKEKDHVEGFAPECAWVTYGGGEKLEERYCIRPTSETLFCEHFKNIIHSHRDLPKIYNQWCSVLRWEKTSRPFLRHREFLWQEGHTMHETEGEAREETLRMLNIYADFCENVLAMPVTRGRKTDKEKFNGAEETYTVECMMHDKKALQAGTSHYFGDGFAKAFEITFAGKDNQPHYPHQTSWGVSTRLIGGIIMTHGDDNGLVLPPRVAPTQVIVIPVAAHKPGVTEAAASILQRLQAAGVRAKMDDSDKAPGWKYAEYEMRGVPLRVEIGPNDMKKEQFCVARRDTGEKSFAPLENLEDTVNQLLDDIHQNLFRMAKENLERNSFAAETLEDVKEKLAENGSGFVHTKWCGDLACELAMKDQAGVSSRCMPLKQSGTEGKCPVCGRPCKTDIIWGVAY
jgi:prolyl-tRNA synthetase